MIAELPIFARVDEYAGAWLIPAEHLAAYFSAIRIEGFRAHFEANTEPLAVVEKQQQAGKTIAVVSLTGLLMKGRSSMGGTSTIEARREIRSAAADSSVDAIMLNIDSPGGTVAGTYELAADINAARKSKPVWSQISGLGASAAYWAASQTDRIIATSPLDQVGSIGTLQVVYDQSAQAANEGVKVLLFSTGPLKGMGTPGTKVTEEQAAHIQQLVDSVQVQFDAAVRKGRGMSADELKAVNHGGVFLASKAIDMKLIDAVQPLSKSINDLARSLSQSGGRQRSDAGLARVASPFPMVKLGTLPTFSQQTQRGSG